MSFVVSSALLIGTYAAVNVVDNVAKYYEQERDKKDEAEKEEAKAKAEKEAAEERQKAQEDALEQEQQAARAEQFAASEGEGLGQLGNVSLEVDDDDEESGLSI